MQRFVNVFLISFLLAMVSIGCDYLEADDGCFPKVEITSCSEFDTMMHRCDPYADVNANGCYPEEICTDLVGGVDTDTSVDTDSSPGDGRICDYKCSGDPVPCEVLDELACNTTVYCQWWHDPNNIDSKIE